MKVNKKKIMLSLLSAVMAFGVVASSAAAAKVEISVQVDSQTVHFPDSKPYSEDGRIMIPIRFVSEALGAEVEFEKTKTGKEIRRVVRIELAGKKIDMPVNSDVVLIGDNTVKLDVPARMQGNRVFVPVRFVSEALGANVNWIGEKRLVDITTDKATEPTKPVDTKDGAYQPYEFKAGFTTLAKELFLDNMKVTNGKLTFMLPKGASATHYSKNGASTELVAGKTYTYTIGEGNGFISFSLSYKGKLENEGYGVFLDSKNNENLAKEFGNVTDDAIVVNYRADGKRVAGTLAEVIQQAKLLK
jgi:hypothetical protein